MHCYQSTKDLQNILSNYSDIAFVPTMGNLHEGHLKLVEKAKSLSNHIVVSIFINPTQFNSKKDFDAYPKTLTNDKDLLKSVHTDSIIFSPSESEILSYIPFKQYELPEIANDLCGKYRPGHFNGVIHIINILFNLIQPKFAVFGKKDYQQLKLIKEFSGKHYPTIQIIEEETVRASNFLALSSRNNLLNNEYKLKANELYFSLKKLIEMIKLTKEFDAVTKKTITLLNSSGWDVEYIAVRNQSNLKKPSSKDNKLVVLAAAKLDNIRLIDNIEFCID
jgi:pantoate--beta-alanine ligase